MGVKGWEWLVSVEHFGSQRLKKGTKNWLILVQTSAKCRASWDNVMIQCDGGCIPCFRPMSHTVMVQSRLNWLLRIWCKECCHYVCVLTENQPSDCRLTATMKVLCSVKKLRPPTYTPHLHNIFVPLSLTQSTPFLPVFLLLFFWAPTIVHQTLLEPLHEHKSTTKTQEVISGLTRGRLCGERGGLRALLQWDGVMRLKFQGLRGQC